MYKPNITTSSDVMNYIDGTDIYNSLFISELLKADTEILNFDNNKFPDRIDLVCKNVYSDPELKSGIVGVINGFDFLNLDENTKSFKYIEPSILSKIINKV